MLKSEILLAAQFSRIAYKECSHCCPRTDTQFWAWQNKENFYLAFRGSSNILDWLTNLKLAQAIVPFEKTSLKIKAHLGFVQAYHSVREAIFKYLEVVNKPIIVTGHSLGGAIATLAACDIQYQTGNAPKLITFGTPKIGNEAWAASVAKRIPEQYRLYNTLDPIPYTPMGYLHPSVGNYFRRAAPDPHNLKIYLDWLAKSG